MKVRKHHIFAGFFTAFIAHAVLIVLWMIWSDHSSFDGKLLVSIGIVIFVCMMASFEWAGNKSVLFTWGEKRDG